MTLVSLVVCTLGRYNQLSDLFKSLESQTYHDYEVILVDQNPPSFLDSLVTAWKTRINIKYFCVNFVGLSRARNFGLRHATGEIIAFPDDDCRYLPRTIEKSISVFQSNPDLDILIAREISDPFFGELKMSNEEIKRVYTAIDLFACRAISFTIFTKKTVIESLATEVFDTNIGLGSNSIWGSGEETDFLIRAKQSDHQIASCKSIAIWHAAPNPNPLKAMSYGLGRYKIIRKNKLGAGIYLLNLLQPLARIFLDLKPRYIINHFATFLGRTGLPLLWIEQQDIPISLSSSQLRSLQQLQLKVLIEFKRLCNINKLNYFLVAGTLLGSVRHKGFIPWDDDIDVALFRDDFEKFIDLAQAQSGTCYAIESIINHPSIASPSARFVLRDSICLESYGKELNPKMGIGIDVFPLDIVPNNQALRLLHACGLTLLKSVALIQAAYRLPRKKSRLSVKLFYWTLAIPLAKIIPQHIIRNILPWWAKFFSGCKSPYIGAVSGSYGYYGEIINRNWMLPPTTLEFEGHSFQVPYLYNEYLRKLYGDFQLLPPKEFQHPRHDLVEISYRSIPLD